MKKISILLLLITSLQAYCQEDCEEKITDFKKIENPKLKDFEGQYQFGESEAEWNLYIMYSNGNLYACAGYPDFSSEQLNYKEKRLFPFLENEILSFKNDESNYGIYNSKYNNEKFIIEEYGKDNICWGGSDDRKLNKPEGIYPETSFVKLNQEELAKYSSGDLKIMRNEIFARNGHIFIQGGRMDTYFSSQTWYKGTEKLNVNELSDVEKHNIKLIKGLE